MMKNFIQAAHEIKQGSTARYLDFTRKMDKEVAEIRRNKNLSTIGQDYSIKLLKEDMREDLMRLTQDIKKEYQNELKAAKAAAEKILEAPAAKPDEKALTKYRAEFEELKTKVLLSLKSDTAKSLVESFAKEIKDPYIAREFRNEYASVITPIISTAGNEAPAIKLALSKVYSHLNDGFMTDEQKEAHSTIETVNSMIDLKVYSPAVSDSVDQYLGRGTSQQMSNPDEFFEKKAAEENPEQ